MLSPATDAAARGPDEHRVALTFAAWMTGSQSRAAAEVEAAAATDPAGLVPLLAAIVRSLTRQQRRETAIDRRGLDDLLRSDPTVAVGLEHPLVSGEPRRLRVLQAELRRVCLSTTLRTLPVAPRAAFVLLEILGFPFEQVAAVFGTPGAVETAHSRAVRQLEDYLGARCEHFDPLNACHCAARLGIALERGFVSAPTHDDVADAPVGRTRTVGQLYATLPAPAGEDRPR